MSGLLTRSGADAQRIDRTLNYRALPVDASTFDEATRSIAATLITDAMVVVRDIARDEVIDEVLLMSGAQFPEQIPLLDTHDRTTVQAVLGSIRDIQVGEHDVTCRIYFAADVPRAEDAMKLVRQGHIKDMSGGYRVIDGKYIPRGATAVINGRSFTAGPGRTLRVATLWEGREGSVTAIGADGLTKIRNEQTSALVARTTTPPHPDGVPSMNPKVRKYLESLGLRAEATEAEAIEFRKGITDAQRSFAADLESAPITAPAQQTSPADATGQRSAPANVTGATNAANPSVDLVAERAAAMAAERTRISGIQDAARTAGVSDAACRAAIDENISVEAAGLRFLQQMAGGRQAPAAIIRPGIDQVRNVDTLGAGIMLRLGREDLVIRKNATDSQREAQTRLAETGDRFRSHSLRDILQACLQIEGRNVPHDQLDMIRAATVTGTATVLFSTSANKVVMDAFEGQEDTTDWCSEHSLNDFKSHDFFALQKQGQFSKLPRGGTANQVTYNELAESMKGARFAAQAALDEQDIIDDNMDVLMTILPEMGEACGRLRPDLVYATLLANPTLSQDSVTLFHTSSHGANSSTGALAVATLQASMAIMMKQRDNGVPLNVQPEFLIVPPDLVFAAKQLASSALLISSTTQGNANAINDWNLKVRGESRIGVAGVTNPSTKAAYTGTATNYFLASKKGRTIGVGYVRGQKTPRVRTFNLDQGQYGMGFDVNLDIAVAALGFQGLLYSTGA